MHVSSIATQLPGSLANWKLSRNRLVGSQSGTRQSSRKVASEKEAVGASTAPQARRTREKQVSRNSPSLAVALSGMGSSSLNAEVNALESLQMVRGRNSSYFEIQIMHRTGKMFRGFQFALDKRLVDDHLGSDVCQFTSLLCFDLLSHRLKIPLHSIHSQ